jgi:Gpi18-like mannosyltransferase
LNTARNLLRGSLSFAKTSAGINALVLLGIALALRVLIGTIQISHGIQQIPFLPLSSWHDYYQTYGFELHSLQIGLLPYRDFYSNYPPLFLYGLYMFYAVGGIHAGSIPILLADSATAPVIYLIALRNTNEKIAFLAGMAYCFFPLALIMEGYLWLSSQPMVFFLILSVYFLQEEQVILSTFALALATLFKQEAIFILPAYLVWCVSKKKMSDIWKTCILFTVVLVSVSIPFLIEAPTDYLYMMSYQLLYPTLNYQGLIPQTLAIHGLLAQSTIVSTMVKSCSTQVPQTLTAPFVACGVTYSTASVPLWTSLSGRIVALINFALDFSYIPIFLLVGPMLYFYRRKDDFLELACAYSVTGSLLIFSFLVHGVWLYYFIPAYALIFSSTRTKSGFFLISAVSLLSVLTPDGSPSDPILLIGIAIFLMLIFDGHSAERLPRVSDSDKAVITENPYLSNSGYSC